MIVFRFCCNIPVYSYVRAFAIIIRLEFPFPNPHSESESFCIYARAIIMKTQNHIGRCRHVQRIRARMARMIMIISDVKHT